MGQIAKRLDEDANSLEDYEYEHYYEYEIDPKAGDSFKRETTDTLDLITEDDINNIDQLLFKTVQADLTVSGEDKDTNTNNNNNVTAKSTYLESDTTEFGYLKN